VQVSPEQMDPEVPRAYGGTCPGSQLQLAWSLLGSLSSRAIGIWRPPSALG